MGLEITELIMACEDDFGVRIDDNDADVNRMETVGDLHQCILRLLSERKPYRCPRVPVFFALRRAMAEALSSEKRSIRPDSPLADLFPTRGRRRAWHRIQHSVPYSVPPLHAAIQGTTINWISVLAGLPLGIFAGTAAYTAFQSIGLSELGLPVCLLLPLVLPLGLSRFLSWALRRGLPARTPGDLTDDIVGRTNWAIAPDGTPWNEDSVWQTLLETVSIRFDVDKSRITPETHFVKDLGFG